MSEKKIVSVTGGYKNQKYFGGLKGLLVPEVLAANFHIPKEEDKEEILTPLGKKVKAGLEEILGITRFIFDSNENSVYIDKGAAFDWKDIEPLILYVLETLINDPDAELLVENKTLPLKCVSRDCFYWERREYSFNRVILNSSYYCESFCDCFNSPLKDIVREISSSPMIDEFVKVNLYTIVVPKIPKYKWSEVEEFLKPIFEKLIGEPVEIIYWGNVFLNQSDLF